MDLKTHQSICKWFAIASAILALINGMIGNVVGFAASIIATAIWLWNHKRISDLLGESEEDQ